jgi:hypothetical protein
LAAPIHGRTLINMLQNAIPDWRIESMEVR